MFHVEHCSTINLLLIKDNYTFANDLKYFPGNNYKKNICYVPRGTLIE